MKLKHVGALVSASTLLSTAIAAIAQEQQERSSPLEEIVVTAERREQRLQDVPLSITAFGSETRDRVGIMSIQDMADFTPGVSYGTSTDRPSIRGIARQSNSFSMDSPVANYFDGVYTSSVQDAQRRPIFIERTEILRGPQGALSGRGSIGGAINTHSKRPSDEFGMEVRTYAENFSAYGAETTITGPLTDWLRARINLGAYRQDDGFFENVATGHKEGDQPNNRQNGDYLFEIDITENLDLFLKFSFADYDETRRTGGTTAPYVADMLGAPASPYGYLGNPLTPIEEYGYFDPSAAANQAGSFTENPVIVTGDKRKFSSDFKSRQQLDDHHNYTAHLTWRTDLFDVKWIGAHQNYSYAHVTDGDGTAITAMTLPTGRVVNPSSVNRYSEEREWFSNEFTLTSNSEGPFRWIAGIYQSVEDYLQQPLTLTHEGYDELATPFAYSNDFFFQPNPALWNPLGAAPNVNGNASVFGQVDGETTSSAVFGQIEYEFSEQWKLTVGARYNKDEKEAQEQTRYIGNNFGASAGVADLLAGGALLGVPLSLDATPAPSTGPYPEGVLTDYIDPTTGRRVRDMEGDWNTVSGTIGIDYTPNEDTLVFFRMASGYRPGGFNAGFLANAPQVEEETVLSYELGYKATLAEQLQLSLTGFYYDYQDQQLTLPALGRCTNPDDLNTCTIVSNFFNIPSSESLGLEVELMWFATDNLSFMFNYGYLDATIKDGLLNGSGFQNPDDPAAVLPNANRYQELAGPSGAQIDAGYTNLPRWTQDISGNKTSYAPEHKVAFNTSYVMEFSPGDLTLSTNYVWRDESYSDVFETEPGIVDGYGMVDARLIWNDKEGRYTVILYGSNLTDEDARDGGGVTRLATPASGAAGQAYFETFNLVPPRTYGLELQYRFGG